MFVAPAASCAKVESTRVSHHRYAETVRHSLRNGFKAYTRSPRCPGLIAAVVRRSRRVGPVRADIATSTNLTSASGGQDHTILPSAPVRFVVARPVRPSHPAPNVRDDREMPLLWKQDGAELARFLIFVKRKIRGHSDLDEPNKIESVHEIGFSARAISCAKRHGVGLLPRKIETDSPPSGRRLDATHSRCLPALRSPVQNLNSDRDGRTFQSQTAKSA